MKRKDSSNQNGRCRKEAKRARKLRANAAVKTRLNGWGRNDPHCIFCGENDWCVLEKHHIAGKAYDDFTGIHCRNCHRKQSDRQKDHPEPTGAPLGLPEAVGRFLLGLADFFELLIEKLREFGEALIANVQAETATPEVRS